MKKIIGHEVKIGDKVLIVDHDKVSKGIVTEVIFPMHCVVRSVQENIHFIRQDEMPSSNWAEYRKTGNQRIMFRNEEIQNIKRKNPY